MENRTLQVLAPLVVLLLSAVGVFLWRQHLPLVADVAALRAELTALSATVAALEIPPPEVKHQLHRHQQQIDQLRQAVERWHRPVYPGAP